MAKLPEFPASAENMAVDMDGTPLAMSPEDVRAYVLRMVDEGEIIAVIARHQDELAVQVFGPPSRKLLGILEDAVKAYRRVLRGH